MSKALRIEQRPGMVAQPDSTFQWPTTTAHAQAMDESTLDAAAAIAASNQSDSLLVVRNGHLVFEQYWNGKTPLDVQQTFSGTKSVYALLVGRAISKGYLDRLDQPVRDLVAEMPAAQSQLTFRNVMAMASGMENSAAIEALGQTGLTQLEIALERKIVAAPLELYHYNNAAYRLTFTALERASGLTLEELTAAEIFEPLAFSGAHWMRIYAVDSSGDAPEKRHTGYQSIRMTPRDFAKSAQVIVDGGLWNGERYLAEEYVTELVRGQTPASAPGANPSFGLFHHLNAGRFYRDFAVPDRIERRLIPGAPDDAFLMFGSGGQVVAGIPSRCLVAVRTGPNAGSIYDEGNYIAQLIACLSEACR